MLPHMPPFARLRLLALLLGAVLAVGCSPENGTAVPASPQAAEPSTTEAGEPPQEQPSGTASPEAAPRGTDSPGAGSSSAASTPSAVPTVPARGTPTELEPSEPFGLSSLILRGPGGREVEVPVYIAATREQRARGLMEREFLPADTGMVFLFPSDSRGAFYMYRTRIPLSIAFFAADGRVVSILDMEPCPSEEPGECPVYPPGETYRVALEVNQGYFAELGVDEGWTVDLPEDLPPAS